MAQIASTMSVSSVITLKETFPGPITQGPETGSASVVGVNTAAATTAYSTAVFRGWNGSLPVVERPNGTWDTLTSALPIQ